MKQRQVYDVDTNTNRTLEFLRLNVNDAYNNDMGGVDIVDQLRNYSRYDHWMQKRKWWWSFFFWGLGVLQVNAYVSYRTFCENENIKALSHYEFRKMITLAWMDSNANWPTRFRKRGGRVIMENEQVVAFTESEGGG